MSRIQNTIHLLGNIASPIETKTFGDNKVANFTVAVNRPKGKKEEAITDFIPCCAWNYTADFVEKYLGKGSRVAVQGELNIDTYEKNGERRSAAKVRVDSITFADSGKDTGKPETESTPKKSSTRSKAKPPVDDEDLPWS